MNTSYEKTRQLSLKQNILKTTMQLKNSTDKTFPRPNKTALPLNKAHNI